MLGLCLCDCGFGCVALVLSCWFGLAGCGLRLLLFGLCFGSAAWWGRCLLLVSLWFGFKVVLCFVLL